MFIEKISDEAKMAYIQKLVDKENVDVVAESLFRPVKCKDWEAAEIKKRGYDKKIADLQKRNVYFDFYERSIQYPDGLHTYQYAFAATFGDTSVKTFKGAVDEVINPLYENIDIVFRHINNHERKFKITDPLEVNNAYVKEFMLPNLQALDEKQNTHLVADYKEALNNQFAKKKHLAIQNIQKQQDDLGLEK